MSIKLRGLLQRIASPFVSVRLAKEEICLSMAAIARLHLTKDEISHIYIDPITTRAQRVSNICTPMELGMLSDGAAALCCKRFDVADAFISELYMGIRKGNPTRIGYVISVIQYTKQIPEYCNETINVILKSTPKLLHKNDNLEILKSFIHLAQFYLSTEEVRDVLEELRKKATNDQLNFIKNILVSLPSKQELHDAIKETKIIKKSSINIEEEEEEEIQNENNNNNNNNNNEEENENGWTAPRARRWISQRIKNANNSWKPSEAVQALELYSHFNIRDPILHEKIQDIVTSIIPLASKVQLDEISKVALTSSHIFPRVSEALNIIRKESTDLNENNNNNNNNSSALTKSFRTSQAYERLLIGRKIPDNWMLEIMQEQDGTAPVDIAAQAACIFAEKGEIPEGIILQLSTELNSLSPNGVAAFIRAVRRDASGVLLPHCSNIFHQFTNKGIQEANMEVLLQICKACEIPLPRCNNMEDYAIFEKEGMLNFVGAIISRLLSIMQDMNLISSLCEIAKITRPFDKNNEVIQFVSSKVLTQKDITINDILIIIDMLHYRSYVHEPLLDMIEPFIRELVEKVENKLRNNINITDLESRQLSVFAAIQANYDSPDLDITASLLLHMVEENIDNIPVEILPGVGLLSLRSRRDTTVSIIQDKIIGKVDKLSNEAIGNLVRLLSQVRNLPRKDLIGEIFSVVTDRLSYQESILPDIIGLTVAVHCKYGDTVDVVCEKMIEYLLEWISAISSEVYTLLCQYVHLKYTSDSLTNGLMDEFPRRLNLLSIKEISDITFGLGEVDGIGQRLSHQIVAEKCSDYVIDNSNNFWSGMDIAHLLYGFSRMQCTKRSLYNVFATRLALRPILSSMNIESITLVIGAFGRSKYLDKKLFDSFSRKILEKSNNLQAADLLLTIRGFSRVMLLNDQLYNDLGNKAAEKVKEFPIESQCTLLSSFGSLGIEHEKIASSMLDGIIEKIEELENANKAVDVIASLWQMHHDIETDERVTKLADYIVDKSEELNGESIGKLCVVLNDTNWKNISLIKAIAEQSVKLQIQKNISSECCRAVLDVLSVFMIHHQGARENLSSLARSVSKEKIQLSEDEEQQIQLLLRR